MFFLIGFLAAVLRSDLLEKRCSNGFALCLAVLYLVPSGRDQDMFFELSVELVPLLHLEVEEATKLAQSTLGRQSLVIDEDSQSIHLLRGAGTEAVVVERGGTRKLSATKLYSPRIS